METMTVKEGWIHPFEKTGLGKAPFRVVGFVVMKFQAHPDAPVQPGSSCDHCGTSIMNVFRIKGANGETFKVGIDCVRKTYDKGLRIEAQKVAREYKREVVRIAREASRTERAKTARETFMAANPGIELAMACGHKITDDLASKLKTYGSLSPAQVELAWKLYAETFAPAARTEENVKAPIAGKRQTVRGRVVSVREHPGFRGRSELKITVKVSEQGPYSNLTWLTWGSFPSDIEGFERGSDLRNAIIEFDATLKASDRDEHFCFFKRPTKARIVEASTENVLTAVEGV